MVLRETAVYAIHRSPVGTAKVDPLVAIKIDSQIRMSIA